ncbi:ALDH-like protein [Imleria badia]|nr:ALDH-like protein [Imleria badia]
MLLSRARIKHRIVTLRDVADVEVTALDILQTLARVVAIERIYVHESTYDEFVTRYVDLVKKYVLGDPIKPDTSLGPVSMASTEKICKQVADAGESLTPEDLFPIVQPCAGTAYVAPQVLVNVNHRHSGWTDMGILRTSTARNIRACDRDPKGQSRQLEDIRLMNDSPYGLTASVWTNAPDSEQAFMHIVDQLQTGTMFLNR